MNEPTHILYYYWHKWARGPRALWKLPADYISWRWPEARWSRDYRARVSRKRGL